MGNDDTDGLGAAQKDRPSGRTDRDPELLFGGGVVLGAVVLGMVWALVSMLGGTSDEAPDGSAGAGLGSPLVGTAATKPEPSRLERCGDAAFLMSRPLEAAGPAMDQWAVHIGAMNKLVVGAINLQQANAFWNQTRVGAHHRIKEFREAMHELRLQGVDCPTPRLLPRTATATVRTCVQQVDADMRTLDAARTAIDTWSMHVADMERLRTGKLSPAAATRMWLSMWRTGQQQLDDYRASARSARAIGGCTLGAPASQPADPSPAPPTAPSTAPSMDMGGMH